MFRITVEERYKEIQDSICKGLEDLDGKAKFIQDNWDRPGGGGGRTRVITNGNLIEKGGVNFSAVHGKLSPTMVKALNVTSDEFFATGVSIVLHPHNPFVPIIHANIRYFEITYDTYWFGGGIDVTPHYVVPNKAATFHKQLKKVCEKHNATFYSKFKDAADDYFYITHRHEMRGIGGIFYDRLNEQNTGLTKNQLLDFSADVGNLFVPAYAAQVTDRNKEYSEQNKLWQNIRRSRYVEFNLVYDAGTKFGLETAGRIESILMSMPPEAQWLYDYHPEPGTPEFDTLQYYKKGINWVQQ